MPDPIDLERSDYADRDPKTGKWRRPLSKKTARNWSMVAAAILAFFWWHVSELTPGTAFGVGVMFAFFAGIFAQQWLKDLY